MANIAVAKEMITQKNKSFLKKLAKDIKKNYVVYLMALPVIAFYIIFHYVPMYGVIIAFKQYSPALGVLKSPWVGFKHFKDFFGSVYIWRLLRNTVNITLNELIWGFPAPVILALLINELRNQRYKKVVQTISYIPHFISLVVICGIIRQFCGSGGIINDIIEFFGGTRQDLLAKPEWFVPVYVASGIWQGVGFGTIIYLAALSGISQELYDAAYIDGAGRWKQTLHITIPGIMPTIIILLILRMGSMLSVGYEKILLLYNRVTYETADVISTFVYRKGLMDANYSYSTAVGLFNSVVNFALLILANKLSKKFSDTSLW